MSRLRVANINLLFLSHGGEAGEELSLMRGQRERLTEEQWAYFPVLYTEGRKESGKGGREWPRKRQYCAAGSYAKESIWFMVRSKGLRARMILLKK